LETDVSEAEERNWALEDKMAGLEEQLEETTMRADKAEAAAAREKAAAVEAGERGATAEVEASRAIAVVLETITTRLRHIDKHTHTRTHAHTHTDTHTHTHTHTSTRTHTHTHTHTSTHTHTHKHTHTPVAQVTGLENQLKDATERATKALEDAAIANAAVMEAQARAGKADEYVELAREVALEGESRNSEKLSELRAEISSMQLAHEKNLELQVKMQIKLSESSTAIEEAYTLKQEVSELEAQLVSMSLKHEDKCQHVEMKVAEAESETAELRAQVTPLAS
jgi:hypothetical protein